MKSADKLADIRDRVERSSGYYYNTPQQQGIDRKMKQLVVDRCIAHIKGPRVLDLGFVDSMWPDTILALDHEVDIVEGASRHYEKARSVYANDARVRIFHSLFEEFSPDRTYDTIIAGDMLRYLKEPRDFLIRAHNWLSADGQLIATVPNNRSLHKRVGVLLGLEVAPSAPTEQDLKLGNQHNFDRYSLRALLIEAGYTVLELHGCVLKPLSSKQMEGWSDELLRAFLLVGDEIEDYAWFLYAVGV
jgi:hypothetical protein